MGKKWPKKINVYSNLANRRKSCQKKPLIIRIWIKTIQFNWNQILSSQNINDHSLLYSHKSTKVDHHLPIDKTVNFALNKSKTQDKFNKRRSQQIKKVAAINPFVALEAALEKEMKETRALNEPSKRVQQNRSCQSPRDQNQKIINSKQTSFHIRHFQPRKMRQRMMTIDTKQLSHSITRMCFKQGRVSFHRTSIQFRAWKRHDQ